MKIIKKYIFLLIPYSICIIAFFILYFLGLKFNNDVKSIIHGVAGTFLSIPLLFMLYELSKNYSSRKLNVVLYDYAKMQIDRDILSLINQLMKIILPYENIILNPKSVRAFLSYSEQGIVDILSNSNYFGFQILKKWNVTENNITTVLENPFILQHLENDHIIKIIELLQSIKSFSSVLKNSEDLYDNTGKSITGFKIEKGTNLNPENNIFSERYLLLKHLDKDKYIVQDFGDFQLFNIDKLLNTYRINSKYLSVYSSSIFSLITNVKEWIELTGNELIIDPEMFKSKLNH